MIMTKKNIFKSLMIFVFLFLSVSSMYNLKNERNALKKMKKNPTFRIQLVMSEQINERKA